MTYECNDGRSTSFSFTKRGSDMHRSVTHDSFDLPTFYDSKLLILICIVCRFKKIKISKRRESRAKIDSAVASNAENLLMSSLLQHVNRDIIMIAENGASSSNSPAEKLSAGKSDSTEQYTALTAAELTEMLVGKSFIVVDDERADERHCLEIS